MGEGTASGGGGGATNAWKKLERLLFRLKLFVVWVLEVVDVVVLVVKRPEGLKFWRKGSGFDAARKR